MLTDVFAWLPLVVGPLVALGALVYIIRGDRPGTPSEWGTSLFAAAFFGSAMAFATWLVGLYLSMPLRDAAVTIGVLLGVGYAFVGAMYGAWELQAPGRWRLLRAAAMFVAWPVLMLFIARAFADLDED